MSTKLAIQAKLTFCLPFKREVIEEAVKKLQEIYPHYRIKYYPKDGNEDKDAIYEDFPTRQQAVDRYYEVKKSDNGYSNLQLIKRKLPHPCWKGCSFDEPYYNILLKTIVKSDTIQFYHPLVSDRSVYLIVKPLTFTTVGKGGKDLLIAPNELTAQEDHYDAMEAVVRMLGLFPELLGGKELGCECEPCKVEYDKAVKEAIRTQAKWLISSLHVNHPD